MVGSVELLDREISIAIGDSSHVDDEREGPVVGPIGARTLPEREQEFGHVASACGRK
jgi:hypothetical protein